MKYLKVIAGHYQSEDGRIDIVKVRSEQTRRRTEICWEVWIDGKTLPSCADTKREAIENAQKYLASKSGYLAPWEK